MADQTRRYIIALIIIIVVVVICQSTKAKDYSCKTNEIQFRCATGDKCIPKKWECDDEDDCGDSSDEKHCNIKECGADEFSCHDGSACIAQGWTCDGTHDCDDKSDEDLAMCNHRKCTSKEFACPGSHRCIPLFWKCDGANDCDEEGSDEPNCAPKKCLDTEFQCKNNECIDRNWECDHDKDCDDGSDEHCPPRDCSPNQFKCNNSRCIHKEYYCDNFDDCKDNSDEPPSCKPKIKCKHGYFDCGDGDCIRDAWKCDGAVDCSNGRDEAQCKCPKGKFMCVSGDCIDSSFKCDGKKDCSDGSDEESCVRTMECSTEQFECKKPKQCIDALLVCNNRSDCEDNSDESPSCGINECQNDNGGCEHGCIDMPIGYRCTCAQGYQLSPDNRTCQDFNECAELGKCSQNCKNKMGSYKCSCQAGYYLDGKDKTSCKAIEREPYLAFSDRHSIRKLTLHKSQFLGLVPDLSGSIALDYDLAEGWMYWSDVKNQIIQRTSFSGYGNKTNKVETVIRGVLSDGIAIDWVARKLYWTDALLRYVEVSELDGSMKRTLISNGLDMPRAVVLHPAIGEMFWTDWGLQPRIEKCGMDGDPTSRKAIVTSDILWPNGLTVDYTLDRLWWADAKRQVIEHCDLNGGQRKVILAHEHVFHPFSISVFEDTVYWTDWFKTSIIKANKFTGTNVTILKANLLQPNAITVIHPQRKPPAFNFCQKLNGYCSHLCLLSARRNKSKVYSCACPNSVKLLSDGKTCDTPEAKKCTLGICNNGTCLPGNEDRGPKCSCHQGYSGIRCEYKIILETNAKTNSGDDIAVTIGISVGVVILIFLTGGIIGVIIYRKIQKRYDPNSLNFDNPVYTKTTESIDSGGGTLLPFRFRKSPPEPPFSRDPEPVDLY